MGNKKIFARGYSASRAEKERQDKARENAGKRLFRFFLKDDGDEAEVRFLTEEPVNFYEHNVKRGDRFESFVCTGDDCHICEDGDRATFKGAYLIVDRREYEYTNNKGEKKTGKNQVKLFVMGMKVISQLDRIHDKYGLSNRDVNIVRLGKGTSTTYTIERGEEDKLSQKEIEALLPEKIRDQYDGTMDSLMTIVENQIMMSAVDYKEDEEDEEEETSTETTSGRDRLINYEDDDEDDEEVEEEKPKRKLSSTKGKSMFKKSEQSLKPRAKTLLKNNS